MLGAVVALGAPAPALAAGSRATEAATPASVAAVVRAEAGVAASRVTAVSVCPPARAGHASCQAQVLELAATHTPVRPHVRRARAAAEPGPAAAPAAEPAASSPPPPGSPAYFQQAYDLGYLSQAHGSADTVAIVDAYNDPTAASDLAFYRAFYGLPACTPATGCFQQVNETGQAAPLPPSSPSGDNWEPEESLDLDAVSALCPNCHIILVEANSDSWSDLEAAVATAASMNANQISMSFGGVATSSPGGTWTFAGISSLAATGDHGYPGAGNNSYPAALAGVTAVGGTTLTPATAPGPRGFAESAWSLSGGWGGGSGCDTTQTKPAYQTDTGCQGRSYSDVSAVADPSTGLDVYDSGDGGWLLEGGTSLATPLTAAFEAVTGVNGTTPAWAYQDSAALNDVTTGSVGSCATAIAYICDAGVGYDGPTGVGSISGTVTAGGPGIGGPSTSSAAGNTYLESLTPRSALVSAGVYPNGADTTYHWEYGPTIAYGQSTPAVDIGAGSSPVTVTSTLAGLAPNTTYHYRLVATNSYATAYGYDYSLTTPNVPPADLQAPAVSGSPDQGAVLTAGAGTWSPSGTASYQWQTGPGATGSFTDVPGATNPWYQPAAADIGRYLRVVVTETDSAGATSAASAPVGPVLSSAPADQAAPQVYGAAMQGQPLSADTGDWSPGGSVSYAWQTLSAAGWQSIPGATGAAYTPVLGDVGQFLRVLVTVTNPYGSASAASSAVGPVVGLLPTVTALPAVSGGPSLGAVIRVRGGAYFGGTVRAVSFYRCGLSCRRVGRAGAFAYRLGRGDVGQYIRARVTISGSAGQISLWAGGWLGPVGSTTAARAAAAGARILQVRTTGRARLATVHSRRFGHTLRVILHRIRRLRARVAVRVYILRAGVPVAGLRPRWLGPRGLRLAVRLAPGETVQVVLIRR